MRIRTAVRRALWLTLPVLLVAALWLGLLLYPTPLFAHRAQHGRYRVYSDAPLTDGLGRTLAELERRVAAMDPGPGEASQRIYLCASARRYRLFAWLTRMSPNSQAIGLSRLRTSFVSLERVASLAREQAAWPPHSRFNGDLATVVAHELAHFGALGQQGLDAHRAQPVWKREGWADYQANLAALRDDPGYRLEQRIGWLLDEARWPPDHERARRLWRWQLTVEYLAEVEGLGLAQLGRPGLTQAAARQRMLAWHAERAASR